MIIDAHHHLWDPARSDYPWMTAEFAPIRRRFGPEDLEPLLARNRVERTVVVQARMTLQETHDLLAAATSAPFMAGVVGWVDLTDEGVADAMRALQGSPGGEKLVGVRHVVHDEEDPAWLLRTDVQRGFAAVAEAGLTYDFLVRPRELPAALETARRHPELRFVIDHLGNPTIRTANDREWTARMAPFADLPNVYCKVSGLATQADWSSWQASDFEPYVRRAFEWFGEERMMVGSDWPVCLLAGSYDEVLAAHVASLGGLAAPAQERVLRLNATQFYGLSP